MKLQKSTLILVFLALILGGFVYFYEIKGKENREELQSQQKQIFDFSEADIQKLTIDTPKQILEFERTEDDNQPWQMKQPEDVLASDASVSFLLNLLVKEKSERTFSIDSKESQEYGFDSPLATVNVQLENQETHQVILGKPDFEDKFIYAQVDPSQSTEQEIEIILVSKNFQYAVERELEEWKQPLKNSEPAEAEQTPSSEP